MQFLSVFRAALIHRDPCAASLLWFTKASYQKGLAHSFGVLANPSLYIGVRPLDAQRLMTLSAFTAAGQTTANMYQGLLLSALRRVWRRQRRHTNIEDGDWKGNQSNKGIAAKATAGIMPMMLPPGRSR